MGENIENAFRRKKDDIEEQLGLIYQKINKADSTRTKDIELQPVESYVIDTETQQKMADEKKALEVAHYKSLDKQNKKGMKSKGILTNANSEKSQV